MSSHCRHDHPSLTVVHPMVGETERASHTEIRTLLHWVWLPVRFLTYSEADQWITQQQYEADRAIVATRRTSERTT